MTEPIADPAEEISSRGRRRGAAAFVVAAIVTLVAIPAALAAVFAVNEIQSDFTLTGCLDKVEGADSTNFGNSPTDNFYIKFDSTTTNTDPNTGATVLQETLSVRAPSGFFTSSTDTFKLNATSCGFDFSVRLRADATNVFGQPATAGDWSDKGVEMFISKVATPGNDFSNATDWDQSPLIVDDTGAVTNAATGTVTLSDNSNLVVGFRLAGGAPVAGTGEFRFQVEFTPN